MTFSECFQEEDVLAGFDHKALHGLWWKDRDLTDFKSYEEQLDLLSLGGIQKKAALFFIRGIRVHANDEEIRIKFVAPKIPFGLSERFHLREPTYNKRRDRGHGPQQGLIKMLPDGVLAISSWEGPKPGRFEELYTLEEDKLVVRNKTVIGEKVIEGLQVYRRA